MNKNTIVDVILADSNRTDIAFRYLEQGNVQSSYVITRHELFLRAIWWAKYLKSKGIGKSDKIIIAIAPGLNYVSALYGIFMLGAIAVPCYPPFGRKAQERMRSVLSDMQAHAILVDPEMSVSTAIVIETVDNKDNWITQIICTQPPEHIEPSGLPDWMLPTNADLALIQYTSGSTGQPKGVCITHGNLISNSISIDSNMGPRENRIGLTWLPPYHDMGLMGTIILSTYAGWELVMMSPFDYIQDPQRWAQAVEYFSITTAVAPNFALDASVDAFLKDGKKYDLSSLSEFYCGAEPIQHKTIKRFEEAFRQSGYQDTALIPCYGMAEATLFIAGKPAQTTYQVGARPDGRAAISVGDIAIHHQVLIVDPDTKTPVTVGTIGEIWCSGPSVAAGYFGKEQETQDTFRATIEGIDTTFLRTGDLGFFDKNHQLYITGRLKDLIIIDGQNIYPNDIEDLILRTENIVKVAAFQNSNDAGFSIVCELSTENREATLTTDIITQVTKQFQVKPSRVILGSKGSVATTTSGKVRRNATRERLDSGKIPKFYSNNHTTESSEVLL
ncbi:MAG: AMP-binding protein [Mycobacteriaceae bacterium]